MGSAGLARLHGLFAAYKPPGLKWKHLRDIVELQLLKGEWLQPDDSARFLPKSISVSGPYGKKKKKSCDLVGWAERFLNHVF